MEICQRPADIARNDVVQRLGGRREEADLEIAVQEQRGHVRAVEDILQVVRGGTLSLERLLQLAVERRQLFVERLQFLLGRQKLLIGGLVFLVDGQRFLVDRALLLARGFQAACALLQFGAGRLQFPLQLGNTQGVAGRGGTRRGLF